MVDKFKTQESTDPPSTFQPLKDQDLVLGMVQSRDVLLPHIPHFNSFTVGPKPWGLLLKTSKLISRGDTFTIEEINQNLSQLSHVHRQRSLA